MFSFDIRQFLDEDGEAETTSRAKSPISNDLTATLLNMADLLNTSLDALTIDCGPIGSRFKEIQALVPKDLVDIISPTVHLEKHEFKFQRAQQRLADRQEKRSLETTKDSSRQQILETKDKLDELTAGPGIIRHNLNEIKQKEADLLARLEQTRQEITTEQKKKVDLPRAIEEETSKIKSISQISCRLDEGNETDPRNRCRRPQGYWRN